MNEISEIQGKQRAHAGEVRWRDGMPAAVGIALLFAILAALRIAAQSDLHEGDQPKQADYVLDIVCNGNWTVQHTADGTILSKPPLYNWLAAPLVMLFGAEDVWLKMPSLWAALAVVLMTWDMVRRRFGERVALWGSVFMLLTSMFEKQMYYARTDMLLTCFIVMQFWAIVRWEDDGETKRGFRSGWIRLFWIAAALGNLTKGPLAFLPHLALIAAWLIEGRLRERYARLGLMWGLPVALLPVLIWFACACRVEGFQPMYDHMIKAEVVDRFRSNAAKIADKGADKSNRNVFYYLPHVVARALPWSLFGLVGVWSVFSLKKNPELNEWQRALLRLLGAWFFTMLLFFSLVPSKRADRIFPAIPALCLLGGWIFDAFLRTQQRKPTDDLTVPRTETRVVGGIAITIAALFILAACGVAGLEFRAEFFPFNMLRRKLPLSTLDGLAASRALGLTVGAIMGVGGILAIVACVKRFPRLIAAALISCTLALVILYQQALGNWLTTDICQGVVPVCTQVRRRAKADGAQILVVAGSGPSARFYLLQAGLEIQPDDVERRLAQPHPAMYVVGTQASLEKKQTNPGGLKPALASGARQLKIEGTPIVGETAPISPTKWLGAVYVPERK